MKVWTLFLFLAKVPQIVILESNDNFLIYLCGHIWSTVKMNGYIILFLKYKLSDGLYWLILCFYSVENGETHSTWEIDTYFFGKFIIAQEEF